MTLPVEMDFSDPSGSVSRDDVRVDFNIGNGELQGFTTLRPAGVSRGQSSGTLRLEFFFPRLSFTPGNNNPIVLSLTNSVALRSNELRGSFRSQ